MRKEDLKEDIWPCQCLRVQRNEALPNLCGEADLVTEVKK